MPAFVIFVEGTDTEPAKLPVYIVESEEHASLICEGMKESDYQIFDFSFKHCTRSDRGKFAVWLTMICDAREGVYGKIVGGIYKMIDGAYSIMSGRRSRPKIASGGDTETGNGGSTTAKQDDETADDNGQPPAVESQPPAVESQPPAEPEAPSDTLDTPPTIAGFDVEPKTEDGANGVHFVTPVANNSTGDGSSSPSPPTCPIKIAGPCRISVDGQEFTVEPHIAKWIERLIEARDEGEKVTGETLNSIAGHKKNVPREIKKLKQTIPPLYNLLKTKNGKGGGFYLSQ